MDPRREKITENVKVWLPESMLRDAQDAALEEDRSVSELIRRALSVYLYGRLGQSRIPAHVANQGE